MRMNSDLSFIYRPNLKQVHKHVWHLMIDSDTRLGSGGFYKAKISFIKPACQQLKKWKSEGNEVKILQEDNVGQNKLSKETTLSRDWTNLSTRQ